MISCEILSHVKCHIRSHNFTCFHMTSHEITCVNSCGFFVREQVHHLEVAVRLSVVKNVGLDTGLQVSGEREKNLKKKIISYKWYCVIF